MPSSGNRDLRQLIYSSRRFTRVVLKKSAPSDCGPKKYDFKDMSSEEHDFMQIE